MIYGQQDSSSYDSFNTSNTFNDGKWHQALVRVSNNDAEIWVDGNLEESKTMQNSSETTKPMSIGSRAVNLDRVLQGPISDVRIYNRALSDSEINTLYDLRDPSGVKITENDVPNNDDGGVSRYKFDGDVTDSWGTNDGNNNTSVGYTSGVYGDAKKFDGDQDNVTIQSPSFGINNINEFTVTAWLKPANITGDNRQWFVSNNDIVMSYLGDTDSKIHLRLNTSDGRKTIESRTSVKTDVWQHIALQYDASDSVGRIFYNGELKDEATHTVTLSSIDTVWIGEDVPSDYDWYDGSIDDIRFYNQALKETEIRRLSKIGTYII